MVVMVMGHLDRWEREMVTGWSTSVGGRCGGD